MSDDVDDADLQLGGMRALLREMRDATDQEPSPGGLDALMAAARAQVQPPARAVVASASVVTTRPGPLARLSGWLGALARQPAFAAAAMLVVVASVGGVLYLRGGGKVAGQEAAAPARRSEGPSEVPSAAPSAANGASLGAATGARGSASAEAHAATAAEPARDLVAPSAPAGLTQPPAPAPPVRPAARPPTEIASDKAAPTQAREGRAAPKPDATHAAEPIDAPTFGDALAAAGPSKGTGAGGASAGASEEDVAVRSEKPREQADPHAALRAAAARGDCATVRTLAAKLAGAERDRLIATDADVRRCLQVR